jgi:streptogramin lyase
MEPALDFLPDGRVILTLSRKNMLRVYEADGKSAVNYTLGANSQPLGVAVLPTGEVWITDRSTNQIVIFSSLAN